MKKMTDSELERLLGSVAATAEGVRRDCPAEETVAGYVDGGLTAQALSEFEDHLAGCDECSRLVGFLSRARGLEMRERPSPELLAQAADSEAGSPAETGASGSAARRWIAVAASLLVVTSIAYWNLRDATPAPERDQTRFFDNGRSALRIDSPVDGSTVPTGSWRIRWAHEPTSLFYEVRIVDGDGDVVWRSRSENTETIVPLDAGLAEGETYYVVVNARLAGGKRLASRHVAFTISTGPAP